MVRKLLLSLIAAVLGGGIFLSMAQNKQLSGTISDAAGKPVAGATIMVDGTAVGTTSGADGKFQIAAPSNGTLAVSFIGYQSQLVPIAGKTAINVVLKEDTHAIDDVIVVAFGTAKKEAFTGSAAVIKSEDIAKSQNSNVSQALAGRVAGVQLVNTSGQPGSTAKIHIRGFSSINAAQEPLYVVDGIPYEGDLSNLNSQDVESMTVLKDAASTALYGSRGANGVIMITTKRSKSGDAVINVDAKWGVNTRAVKSYDRIDDPKTYYETHYRSLYNYAVDKGQSAADAHAWANGNMFDADNTYGLGYQVFTVPSGQDFIGTDGMLNPNATLGYLHTDMYGDKFWLTPDDWEDAAFSSTMRQEYNVSVSAANDKASFYGSFGYLDDKGIVANSFLQRYNARLKADYQVKKWMKVGANVGYSHSDGQGVFEDASDGMVYSTANLFGIVSRMSPIYPLYIRDENGNIMYDKNGIARYDYGSADPTDGIAGLERPVLSGSNALASNLLDIENKYNNNFFSLTGFAEVTFLKHFKFQFNAGINLDETRTTGYTNPYYGQYADMNGMLSKQHTRFFSYNLQQLLSYTNTFGKHTIDVMAGHENYYRTRYVLNGSKSNMFSPGNMELAGAIKTTSTNSYTKEYNTEGYFGRVQYDFDNRYFLSASYRRDASSRFHPSNRWGNFWSVGAAWLIDREAWFNASWVDMLKFKVSYGQQGNDGIGDYGYTDLYEIANSGGSVATIFKTKGNPDISWEKNSNFNVGVEFDLLGNRLSGSVEYFRRGTKDMLSARPTPASMGYTSYWDNIGDMRNSGLEIELLGVVMSKKNFRWDVNLNMTHYKNKITRLPSDNEDGYRSGNFWRSEGGSIYDYYLRRYAGVDRNTGEALYYKDVKGEDGTTTVETTKLYSEATYYKLDKTPIPDLYGGFGTSLAFYGVDISVNFTYSIGGYAYDQGYQATMGVPGGASNGGARHKDILKAWTPENPDSNIPRNNYKDLYTASTSDRFLTDASFLNLQNINVGYTLPRNITSKIGIDKIRVYLSCENVCYWSKREGFDPRQSFSGSTSETRYSPLRVISGGINLQF